MPPKTEPDPYVVLGVDRAASPDQIRAAYLALVARYHPDKHQGNPLEGLAAEKMAEINRAYEILSYPERRADYDRGHGTWPRAAGPDFRGGPGQMPFPRKRMRWLQILALLMVLPLLFRVLAFLARPLARLVRGAAEVASLARGTPALGVVVLVVLTILVVVLVRRRRRRRKDRAPN